MSRPSGPKDVELRDFKWGIQRGVGWKNKDTHFYESFVFLRKGSLLILFFFLRKMMDLVWHAFKKKVEARVVEQSLNSNNYNGSAWVVFKTKDEAEFAVSELERRCLILGNGRIVSADKGTLIEPGKQSKFTGHLVIDKFAHQKQRREMRNAVSTSHCSQSNTIEYDMAVEWLLEYKKSDAWGEALYQKQMKEIGDVKNKLIMDRIFL